MFSVLACVTFCPLTRLSSKKSITVHCLAWVRHKDVDFFVLELILVLVKCKTQKNAKKEVVGGQNLRLLLLCERGEQEKREEEWGRGGRVSTSRNSNVWHPCSLRGGRTDTKPVRLSRAERGGRNRKGRGGPQTAGSAKEREEVKKKDSGWKRCTRAASVLVLQGQITLFAVWMGAGDLRHEARAMRRQAGLSQRCCWAPVLCQPGLSLGMIAGRGWGTVFFFFSPFRIAELYAAGRCWRTRFERAVICDWTQCATWSLLRLLLPRLLPSPSPPAVFGRWSWLRGWASPRCVAVTEWKVRPINSTMGAKQMKWWESDFTLFQRCYLDVRMMRLLFFLYFFFFFVSDAPGAETIQFSGPSSKASFTWNTYYFDSHTYFSVSQIDSSVTEWLL